MNRKPIFADLIFNLTSWRWWSAVSVSAVLMYRVGWLWSACAHALVSVQRAQLFKVSERERISGVPSWLELVIRHEMKADTGALKGGDYVCTLPRSSALSRDYIAPLLDWAGHITGLERSRKVGAEAVFALGVCMLFLHHLFVKTALNSSGALQIFCVCTRSGQKGSKEMVTMLSSACSCAAISNLFLLMTDLQTGINQFPWSLYM